MLQEGGIVSKTPRRVRRGRLGKVGEQADSHTAYPGGGSGNVAGAGRDGVLVIPQNSEGVDAGETIRVDLLKDLEDIENTIVCIGSHDPILDAFVTRFIIKTPGCTLLRPTLAAWGV